MAEAAPITEDEAAWVVARIGRDGKLSKAEIALLQFIKANSPSVHQKLQILFEQVRPWKAKAEDGSVDLKVA
jgi:DNA-binding response OmpR family regulator